MEYAKSKLKYNQREKNFQEAVLGMDWKVLYKGWPDFLCYKEGEKGKIDACFVEIKRTPGKYDKGRKKTFDKFLSPEQEEMHRVLKSLGFEVKTIYKD